jgi:hypothetical protein
VPQDLLRKQVRQSVRSAWVCAYAPPNRICRSPLHPSSKSDQAHGVYCEKTHEPDDRHDVRTSPLFLSKSVDTNRYDVSLKPGSSLITPAMENSGDLDVPVVPVINHEVLDGE